MHGMLLDLHWKPRHVQTREQLEVAHGEHEVVTVWPSFGILYTHLTILVAGWSTPVPLANSSHSAAILVFYKETKQEGVCLNIGDEHMYRCQSLVSAKRAAFSF